MSETADLKTALLLLCDVLDQAHGGFEGIKNVTYKTSYNVDAHAAWFLAIHGYTEIIKGAWPATKYIDFRFTDKYYSERF